MKQKSLSSFIRAVGAVIGGIAALLSVYWIGYEMGQSSNRSQKEPLESVKVCKNQNSISVISLKGETDQRGVEIISALNELGCKSTGPYEPVKDTILSQPDIRYFHKSDLKDAIALSNFINGLTGLNCKIVGVLELGYKVQKGDMEIWLN